MSYLIETKKITSKYTDYNKHMNMAYYVMIFDLSWEIILAKFQMGENAAKTINRSTMVVETHTTYDSEVLEDEEVDISLTYLNHDKKRLHFKLQMIKKNNNKLAATIEMISLYIDLEKRKVTEFEKEKITLIDNFINENKKNFDTSKLVLSSKIKN